jgi:hypothetical protein
MIYDALRFSKLCANLQKDMQHDSICNANRHHGNKHSKVGHVSGTDGSSCPRAAIYRDGTSRKCQQPAMQVVIQSTHFFLFLSKSDKIDSRMIKAFYDNLTLVVKPGMRWSICLCLIVPSPITLFPCWRFRMPIKDSRISTRNHEQGEA